MTGSVAEEAEQAALLESESNGLRIVVQADTDRGLVLVLTVGRTTWRGGAEGRLGCRPEMMVLGGSHEMLTGSRVRLRGAWRGAKGRADRMQISALSLGRGVWSGEMEEVGIIGGRRVEPIRSSSFTEARIDSVRWGSGGGPPIGRRGLEDGFLSSRRMLRSRSAGQSRAAIADGRFLFSASGALKPFVVFLFADLEEVSFMLLRFISGAFHEFVALLEIGTDLNQLVAGVAAARLSREYSLITDASGLVLLIRTAARPRLTVGVQFGIRFHAEPTTGLEFARYGTVSVPDASVHALIRDTVLLANFDRTTAREEAANNVVRERKRSLPLALESERE